MKCLWRTFSCVLRPRLTSGSRTGPCRAGARRPPALPRTGCRRQLTTAGSNNLKTKKILSLYYFFKECQGQGGEPEVFFSLSTTRLLCYRKDCYFTVLIPILADLRVNGLQFEPVLTASRALKVTSFIFYYDLLLFGQDSVCVCEI